MYLSLTLAHNQAHCYFWKQDSMFLSFQGKVNYELQEAMSLFCCGHLSSLVSLLQKAISFLILIWCNSIASSELKFKYADKMK